MKKFSILAIAFAAIMFAACGNKSAQNEETADSLKSFEQEQIEASIKMHFDSIAAKTADLKQPDFIKDGKVILTKEEKQVKPDYLLEASDADEAATLSEKYRMLSALMVDKRIAQLYDMSVEDYDKATTKLMADINDPSFKQVENTNTIFETTTELYDAMNKNGRINYFWQLAAAALTEELYIANKNQDKFLATMDDDAAAEITYRLVLLLDAISRLAAYDPEIKPVVEALTPLNVLNASSVAELKSQLKEAEDNIEAARKSLMK